MYQEAEDNLELIRQVERRNKREANVLGQLSTAQIQADRLEDEKFEKNSQERIRIAQKKIMESLGFDFEGDYDQISAELIKHTGQQNPAFVSKSPYNDPGSEKYGKKPSQKSFVVSLEEIFTLFKNSLKIMEANVDKLDARYLADEEVAFKNAMLFHSKKYYQESYDVHSLSESVTRNYFSTPFSHKPFTEELLPLLEKTFLGDQKLLNDKKRHFFSFLLDTSAFDSPDIKSLTIDRRVAAEIIRSFLAIRFSHIGIHVRQFYSEDFKKIFMVLKS